MFCRSTGRRANARNVTRTLYGGQFTLSTQLIPLTYPAIPSHRYSITVSLETYLLFSLYSLVVGSVFHFSFNRTSHFLPPDAQVWIFIRHSEVVILNWSWKKSEQFSNIVRMRDKTSLQTCQNKNNCYLKSGRVITTEVFWVDWPPCRQGGWGSFASEINVLTRWKKPSWCTTTLARLLSKQFALSGCDALTSFSTTL